MLRITKKDTIWLALCAGYFTMGMVTATLFGMSVSVGSFGFDTVRQLSEENCYREDLKDWNQMNPLCRLSYSLVGDY